MRLACLAAAVAIAAPAAAADLIAAPAAIVSAPEDVVVTATEDYDRGGFFSEVRLGAAFWALDGRERIHEDGVFIQGQVFLNPVLKPFDNFFADVLLRPRPHLGTSISTAGETNQVFAGVTWTLPLGEVLFLEANFGATLHDRGLDLGHEDGAQLGCHLLFREGAGVGVNLGPRWNVVASVDHSSNAGLCEDNDGLTHAGTSVGYRF
jgi:hypothetical protein